MADFGINWNAGIAPNVGNALMQGIQTGKAMRREADTRNALAGAVSGNPGDLEKLTALDPELGFRVADRQRQQQVRDTVGRVFAPGQDGTGVLSASGVANPAQGGQMAGGPAALVDPAQLPPRTDGLRINPQALRDLYALDPATAHQIQSAVYEADAQSFKAMQARGAAMASAAWHLKSVSPEDRTAELDRITPYLVQSGIPAELVQRASSDLSDTALDGVIATGRNIKDILVDDRQERRFAWDRQDDEADNARQDRNTDSMIEDRGARRALTARGQDLSHSDRRYATDTADRRGRDLAAQTDKRVRESWKVPRVKAGGGAGAPTVKTKAQYDALPSGTVYIAPDGTTKRKG